MIVQAIEVLCEGLLDGTRAARVNAGIVFCWRIVELPDCDSLALLGRSFHQWRIDNYDEIRRGDPSAVWRPITHNDTKRVVRPEIFLELLPLRDVAYCLSDNGHARTWKLKKIDEWPDCQHLPDGRWKADFANVESRLAGTSIPVVSATQQQNASGQKGPCA